MDRVAGARDQFRVILTLRRRLAIRQFKGGPGKVIAAVLVTIVLIPIPVLLAIAAYTGFSRAPEPWPAEILGVVLTVLWGIWLVFPIVIGRLNQGIDLSRLLLYPIHTRALLTGMLAGTVFDYAALFTVPFCIVIIVWWGKGAAFFLVFLSLMVAWCHMVIVGQLVATTLSGLFQSRRFRDITLIAGIALSLAASTNYFWLRRLSSTIEQAIESGRFETFRPMLTLRWLPPGALGRTIESASAGDWNHALLWLGYGLVLLGVLVWAWWRLVMRVTMQGGMLFMASTRQGREPAHNTGKRVRPARGLFTELVLKELRLMWRAPRHRMMVLQGFLLPVVLAVMLFRDGLPTTQDLMFGLPAVVFVIIVMTQHTMLGAEGAGVGTLFLSPLRRRQLFRSKSAAFAVVLAGPFLIVSAVLMGFGRDIYTMVGILAAICVFFVAMSVTSVSSVLLPVPFPEDTKRRSSPFRGNPVSGFIALLVHPLAVVVLCTPAWASMLVGSLMSRPDVALAGTSVGVVISAGIFMWGTSVAGKELITNEPQVYLALRPPPT